MADGNSSVSAAAIASARRDLPLAVTLFNVVLGSRYLHIVTSEREPLPPTCIASLDQTYTSGSSLVNRIIDSVMNNLNTLMREQRQHDVQHNNAPASAQPAKSRSRSRSNASVKTARSNTPYRSRLVSGPSELSSANTAMSPGIRTAEEHTRAHPTARTASFHSEPSSSHTRIRERDARVRDNSAFSDTSAGSSRISTALSPSTEMQRSKAEEISETTAERRARSPTVRTNTNSRVMTPREAWANVAVGRHAVIRPAGKQRRSSQASSSGPSGISSKSASGHGKPSSVVTAREQSRNPSLTALRKGKLFGTSKTPAREDISNRGVSSVEKTESARSRQPSRETRTAAAIGTPCGRQSGQRGQVATTPTQQRQPKTAILYGTSFGTAIIAMAPSEERIPTAVPVGSPCGRVERSVPQGPSAIPTDQMMIHPSKEAQKAAPTTPTTARSVSTANTPQPQSRTPRSRISSGLWMNPTATARSSSGPRTWSATTPPPGQWPQPSPMRTAQSALSPGPPAPSIRTAVNPTDFISPTSASGGKPIADKEAWNLARNASSDPSLQSPDVNTALGASSVTRSKSFRRAPSSSQSPILSTARLPSSVDVFLETPTHSMESKQQTKETREIDDMLREASASHGLKSTSRPTSSQRSEKGTHKEKELVSVQPIWTSLGSRTPHDVRAAGTPGTTTPPAQAVRLGSGVVTARTMTPSTPTLPGQRQRNTLLAQPSTPGTPLSKVSDQRRDNFTPVRSITPRISTPAAQRSTATAKATTPETPIQTAQRHDTFATAPAATPKTATPAATAPVVVAKTPVITVVRQEDVGSPIMVRTPAVTAQRWEDAENDDEALPKTPAPAAQRQEMGTAADIWLTTPTPTVAAQHQRSASSPFTIRTAIKDSMSPTPGVITAMEETMSPTRGVMTAEEIIVSPVEGRTPATKDIVTALPLCSPTRDVDTARDIDDITGRIAVATPYSTMTTKTPVQERTASGSEPIVTPRPTRIPTTLVNNAPTGGGSMNVLSARSVTAKEQRKGLAGKEPGSRQSEASPADGSAASRRRESIRQRLVTMKARQASPVQQQPAANERTARPSTPAIRTARSISTQRRRGLFGGPSSQLRTPGEATSNASKGVRLGRRSRGADSQRAAATPGDSASLTPAPTSRRSRLPILLKRATPILQKPKSSGEPLTAQSKMASQSEPRTSRDDKISRERDKSMSPSSTRTARAQSVSAGSRDDQLTREIDRIRKEIVAEPDTGLVEASTTTRTSEAGATEGASTKSGSAGKTPSQKSKSRRRWLRSIDSRPSYYGSEKRVKKINKRNLKKRSRSQRSGSTLPHASEDKTQQISDDAKSDARDGLNVHRDGSPTLKTAITEIDPALAKAISEAAQNLQPGSIVIHEQNQDGSFKLELHLACRINSTGRLNLSGCAPAGLRPKKVNVNGKEIWAEI